MSPIKVRVVGKGAAQQACEDSGGNWNAKTKQCSCPWPLARSAVKNVCVRPPSPPSNPKGNPLVLGVHRGDPCHRRFNKKEEFILVPPTKEIYAAVDRALKNQSNQMNLKNKSSGPGK